MEKTRVLFVSQEITPYLPETEMSHRGRYLPQGIQEKGKEIRTFMPRFGLVNERRNQLHEVIRLSGMNLIIDDSDHPLIIKVASIQSARMQIYFIDNEDYFQRKHTVKNEKGAFFKDNDERVIFYARGVLETVKKLRWSPDVIHCQGWFAGLVPLYVKKAYNDDPLFTNTKVVYSIYDDDYSTKLNTNFAEKLMIDGVEKSDIEVVANDPDYYSLNKLAIDFSDAFIWGTPNKNPILDEYIKQSGKPYLDYQDSENYIDIYSEFYDKVAEKEIAAKTK